MRRNKRPSGAPVLDWGQDFDGWVLTKAEAGALAPHATKKHPAREHFLPWAFAFGASGAGAKGMRAHAPVACRMMAMDANIFA
jgi:4,5-DOPA dioxygenase extradiol